MCGTCNLVPRCQGAHARLPVVRIDAQVRRAATVRLCDAERAYLRDVPPAGVQDDRRTESRAPRSVSVNSRRLGQHLWRDFAWINAQSMIPRRRVSAHGPFSPNQVVAGIFSCTCACMLLPSVYRYAGRARQCFERIGVVASGLMPPRVLRRGHRWPPVEQRKWQRSWAWLAYFAISNQLTTPVMPPSLTHIEAPDDARVRAPLGTYTIACHPLQEHLSCLCTSPHGKDS